MTTKELSKLNVGSILLDKSTNTLVKFKSPLVTEDSGRRWALVQGVNKEFRYEHYVPVRNLCRVPFTEKTLKAFGFERGEYWTTLSAQEYVWNNHNEKLPRSLFLSVYINYSCITYIHGSMFPLGLDITLEYIDELQELLKAMKCDYPRKLITN